MTIEQPEYELQDKLVHIWEYVNRTRSSHCRTNDKGTGCLKDDKNNYLGHCHHPSDLEDIARSGIRGEP